MRIIAPYTAMHPATHAWLLEHAPNAERVDLNDNAPGYYHLLAALWASGTDFLLVEHDNVPPARAIEGFESCENGWCLHPYLGSQPIWTRRRTPTSQAPVTFRTGLGCTRFRASFCKQHPEAVTHIARRTPALLTHDRLDSQIASHLIQHGQNPCEHKPNAEHHHAYG